LKIDLANDYAIDDSIAVTGGVKALARDSSGNIWVGKGSSSGAGYLAILDTALDTFTPVPTVTDYVMHILPKDDVMLVSWNYGYEHNLFDLTGADLGGVSQSDEDYYGHYFAVTPFEVGN